MTQRPLAGAVAALCLSIGSGAQAAAIDTGHDELKFNLDTTAKYSAAWRLKSASDALLANPNLDDGDRNLDRGLVSNRVDLFSELDLVWAKRLGLRLSGAAWYDQVYNQHNDNPGFAGGAFPNQVSVPANEFTATTRRLNGRGADLLDAFVFASADFGETRASVRLGQHSLLWGESLFFGVNAIAGGMSPVDVTKLISVPNTQFKEAIRPVPQLSAQWQFTPTLSLAAYEQFKWEANRLPAVGSYFSGIDTNPEGAEQLLLAGPGSPFLANAPRLPNQQPSDHGQRGLQLRLRADETDLGFYLIRFHDKTHQLVPVLGLAPVVAAPDGSCPVPGSVAAAAGCVLPGGPVAYRLAYQQGITAFGASVSQTLGDVNLAAEASIRHHQDLASTGGADASALGGGGGNNRNDPGYAIGKTAHVNLNALWNLPPTPLFAEGTLLAELAWNRVLKVTDNPGAVDPNATRSAWAARMQVEPLYRQVMGGLDLGLPIGLGYSPPGSRSMALGPAFPAEGGGDVTVGLNATYLDQWRFSLAWTHYFGGEARFLTDDNHFSYGQYLKDRDFVAFSARVTF